jgi:hypothetical protein
VLVVERLFNTLIGDVRYYFDSGCSLLPVPLVFV